MIAKIWGDLSLFKYLQNNWVKKLFPTLIFLNSKLREFIKTCMQY